MINDILPKCWLEFQKTEGIPAGVLRELDCFVLLSISLSHLQPNGGAFMRFSSVLAIEKNHINKVKISRGYVEN